MYKESNQPVSIKRLFIKAVKKVIKSILFLIYFLPALLLRMFKIRTVNIDYRRIGHLVIDTFCLMREKQLYSLKHKYLLIGSREKFANRYIIKYLRKYLIIVDDPFFALLLGPLIKHPLLFKDVSEFTKQVISARYIELVNGSENMPPLFELSADDKKKGKNILSQLGIPENAWYVCVHNRESGYSGGVDKDYGQDYRNCRIGQFELAMDEIIQRGGYCIRMGDPSMEKAVPRVGLIDYAHHPLRSEFLDLYLSATCKFYLCNSSGLFSLGSIFGEVPAACTNMAPLGAVLIWSSKEIALPKIYIKEGVMQSFGEVFGSPSSNYRLKPEFSEEGIELLENSKEDIRDITIEMLDRIEAGGDFYTEDDAALQNRFRALMTPGNYTYGSSTRIGRAFLKKYEHLLM